MQSDVFLMVLASGLLHAVWNIVAKRASQNKAVNWLAQFVALAVLSTVAIARGGFVPAEPQSFLLVAWAGVSQMIYFMALAHAYRLGDISVVYPIARGLGVGGAAVVGLLLFGDSPSTFGIAGVACVALGTAAIGLAALRASRAAWPSLGFAMVVAATLINSVIVDKQGAQAFDPVAYLALVYCVSCCTTTAFFMSASRRQDIVLALKTQKAAIVAIGIGSSFSYLIILFAFRLGPLGYTVAVRECSVVLGALFGVWVLKEAVTPAKVVGVLAIVLGVVMIRLA